MDKNVETALRYLKDPGYIPFLEKLKKAAVTTLSPLSASAFPSKEPIPFEEARSLPFLPVKKGDPWGGMYECAWFRFTAELIYLDPACDLALLQTEPDGSMKPVTFCEDEAFPGESVYAIGNSKGEGLCIVEGIVSDVNRRVGGYDAIMISAPVTTGNSGGPVFDAEGRLLGIVQSGRTDVSAMNYVIPTKTILAFLGAAKENKNLSF
jgi:hypothetical protein